MGASTGVGLLREAGVAAQTTGGGVLLCLVRLTFNQPEASVLRPTPDTPDSFIVPG